MSNIWEFLLQTLTVSITAAVLLLCKRIFADKLSPKWQYGVWVLLALRILLPAGGKRYVLLPLPVLLETLKASAETGLDSVYAAPYAVLSPEHVLPVYPDAPRSVTDWLFVLYGMGVLLCLLWYLAGYIRLRLAVRHGGKLTGEMAEMLQQTGEKYGLPVCRAVTMPGLTTAFVCGGIRPVLVLPEDGCDEKVLLHELLHLHCRDALQNLFWCLLRCLHWCNPFLWIVCNRIENDMESLCDSRVLERLQGEERRLYGGILLSMANERYARVPGTSSVSNGGKNIARRIEAIVRFKLYPRGMGLVSVCIAVMLALPLLAGTAMVYDQEWYEPETKYQLQRSMAMTRLNRCSTIAGALDTYAKGLLYRNGIALAMVSPLDRQGELYVVMTGRYQMWEMEEDPDLAFAAPGGGYSIFNLTETAAGQYAAWLAFDVQHFVDENGEIPEDTVGLPGKASLCIPVRVWFDDGWVVEETDGRIRSHCDYNQVQYPGTPIPAIREFTAEGTYGTVNVIEHVTYTIDNTLQNSSLGGFFTSTGFDTAFKPHAQFKEAVNHQHIEYTMTAGPDGKLPENTYGMHNTILATMEDVDLLPLAGIRPYLRDVDKEEWVRRRMEEEKGFGDNFSGSSSGGTGWAFKRMVDETNGKLMWGSGDYYYDVEGPITQPLGYAVMIFWDDEPVERITVTDDAVTTEVLS